MTNVPTAILYTCELASGIDYVTEITVQLARNSLPISFVLLVSLEAFASDEEGAACLDAGFDETHF